MIDNIRRTTHFDADLISEILEYAKRHKVAQPKLTPPDGWAEAVERAKFYSSGVEVVGSSIFAQFAKAILDMDAELKKAGPL